MASANLNSYHTLLFISYVILKSKGGLSAGQTAVQTVAPKDIIIARQQWQWRHFIYLSDHHWCDIMVRDFYKKVQLLKGCVSLSVVLRRTHPDTLSSLSDMIQLDNTTPTRQLHNLPTFMWVHRE